MFVKQMEATSLPVCNGSHKFASYHTKDGTKLSRLLKTEEVGIDSSAGFIGHEYLQLAGAVEKESLQCVVTYI